MLDWTHVGTNQVRRSMPTFVHSPGNCDVKPLDMGMLMCAQGDSVLLPGLRTTISVCRSAGRVSVSNTTKRTAGPSQEDLSQLVQIFAPEDRGCSEAVSAPGLKGGSFTGRSAFGGPSPACRRVSPGAAV